MSLFEDTFEVTQVNPDGKKFDKGARTKTTNCEQRTATAR